MDSLEEKGTEARELSRIKRILLLQPSLSEMLWEEAWEAPRWQRILEIEEMGKGRASRALRLNH